VPASKRGDSPTLEERAYRAGIWRVKRDFTEFLNRKRSWGSRFRRKGWLVPVLASLVVLLGITVLPQGVRAQDLEGASLEAVAGGLTSENPLDAGEQPRFQPNRKLRDLLRPDGSLDLRKGLRGSVDARGYRMVSRSGEAPRFEAASSKAPGDERWADIFGRSDGVNGNVYSVASDGRGNLYVGGSFTGAGGVSAKNIAKWNGTSWSALGSGMSGYDQLTVVFTLAFDGSGTLYAGGNFTEAGGAPANYIAKWDGTAWSSLGSGISGSEYSYVHVFAFDGSGDLYACGDFSTAGEKASLNIARWAADSALAASFFSKQGLYLYRKGAWKQINSASSARMTTCGSRLAAVFPEQGLYEYDGARWKQLSARSDVEAMLGIDTHLFVDFGGGGLWRYEYDGSSTQIHPLNPDKLANYAGKLVASFPGEGIHEYKGSAWTRISSRNDAQRMIGVSNRLYVDFGARGLFQYDGSWNKVRSADAQIMAPVGSNLVVSFPRIGLYQHDGKSWKQLAASTATEDLLGIGNTLYVDRGSEGLHKYEMGQWTKIRLLDPSAMASYAGSLVAAFAGRGLLQYGDGRWTRLSPDAGVQDMTGVFFP